MADMEKKIKAYALAQAKKDKDRLTQRDIEKAEEIVGSIKPYVKKKMGGGMMKKPMGYTGGGMCRGMGAAIAGGNFKGVK